MVNRAKVYHFYPIANRFRSAITRLMGSDPTIGKGTLSSPRLKPQVCQLALQGIDDVATIALSAGLGF